MNKEHYNMAYEKYTPKWASENTNYDELLRKQNSTLIDFFDEHTKQTNNNSKSLNILELGTGLGQMARYFASKGHRVVAVDISDLAIAQAKSMTDPRRNEQIFFTEMDVTEPLDKFSKDELSSMHLNASSFDLIFDSHLLHCLTSKEKRENYFKFVKNFLTGPGTYLLESMIFHKSLKIPIGHRLGEDSILYKDIESGEIPYRKLASSLEIEEELKSFNLIIDYLYCHSELSFQVFTKYPDYPHAFLPQTIRVKAKK